MKRLFPILLAALLLVGCAGEPAKDAAVPSATESTEQVELVSLYDAKSQIEKQTDGAVRAYPLGDGVYAGLLTVGQKLLVVAGDGTMTLLQGELAEVAATGISTVNYRWENGQVTATDGGVAYFDRVDREVVLLDGQLNQVQAGAMPVESQSDPVILANGQVFYCAGTQIRALDVRTGISRLVREHNCVSQQLTGSFFNDTVIGCSLTDAEGVTRTVYLYADTGEVISTDLEGFALYTAGETYFAVADAVQKQYIFGSLDTEPMSLYPTTDDLIPVCAMNGAVGYAMEEAGLKLEFYDLATGKRTSEVVLPEVEIPQSLVTDGEYVWMICGSVLYRWDVAATPTTDSASYAAQHFTAEAPDTQGLAACEARAQQLEQTYGVKLHLWEEAAQLTRDYTLQEEYRVSVIEGFLTEVENILATFPENFVTTTGDVTFYLVNTLENGKPAQQYWDGASCHVVLGSQEPVRYFLWGLGFAMDTRVLGNSRDFDDWDDLNPRKFQYTYDYAANDTREDGEKYLDSFVDIASMSFPTEDRSRVFAAAVLPGNEELFQKEDLQDKLRKLCQGIREAYGWDDSTTVFPWEQYLEKPLAKSE